MKLKELFKNIKSAKDAKVSPLAKRLIKSITKKGRPEKVRIKPSYTLERLIRRLKLAPKKKPKKPIKIPQKLEYWKGKSEVLGERIKKLEKERPKIAKRLGEELRKIIGRLESLEKAKRLKREEWKRVSKEISEVLEDLAGKVGELEKKVEKKVEKKWLISEAKWQKLLSKLKRWMAEAKELEKAKLLKAEPAAKRELRKIRKWEEKLKGLEERIKELKRKEVSESEWKEITEVLDRISEAVRASQKIKIKEKELEERPGPKIDIKKINEWYPLIQIGGRAFAWANIRWSPKEESLIYSVIEPTLTPKDEEETEKIKKLLEQKLDIDFGAIRKVKAKEYIKEKLLKAVGELKLDLSQRKIDILKYYIIRNFVGLTEIEPLMQDPQIEDISCDGCGIPIYLVHRNPAYGELKTNVMFRDPERLNSFVMKLAQRCGKSISVADPLLDGSLPDGSRIQATYGTGVARRGSNFSIRKFTEKPMSPIDIVNYGTVNTEMLSYFWTMIEHRKSFLVAGTVAVGKCVAPNQLIQLSDGSIKKAEDLFKDTTHSFNPPGNLIVLNSEFKSHPSLISLDKDLKLHSQEPLAAWRLKAPESLIKVRLAHGSSLIVTPEHPFLTIKDGVLDYKRADELTAGTLVACARKLEVNTKRQKINLLSYFKNDDSLYAADSQKLVKELVKKIKHGTLREIAKTLNVKPRTFYCWLRKNSIPLSKLHELVKLANLNESYLYIKKIKAKTSSKKIKAIKELTPKLGKVVGYILGDGKLEATQVRFYNSDEILLKDFESLIYSIFGLRGKRRYPKERTPYVEICSSALVKILSKVFEIPVGDKSQLIDVPKIILKSDNSVVKAFLQGLFNCEIDASEKRPRLEFSTTSKSLASKLPMLLLRFDIRARRRTKVQKGSISYPVFILGSEVEKFRNRIGMDHSSRKRKMDRAISLIKNEHTNIDLIPISERLKEIKGLIRLYDRELSDCRDQSCLNYFVLGKTSPYRSTLKKVSNSLYKKYKERIGLKEKIHELYENPDPGKLRELMKELKTSQKEVAKEIGVSQSAVYLWLKESRNLREILSGIESIWFRIVSEKRIPKLIGELKRLSLSDVYWESVEKVEVLSDHGFEYVYDFSMPKSHNFLAGGVCPTVISNTTLLNSLGMFIKPELKVITIEETPEIRFYRENWIPQVSRIGYGPPGPGGKRYGEVTMYDLLKSSLRQRPDYLIVGEVRGREASVMFQALSTGHPGLSTLHADALEKVIDRLTTRPISLSPSLLDNLDLIVFIIRVKKGEKYIRRAKTVLEVVDYDLEKKKLITNPLFKWNPKTDSFDKVKESIMLKRISEDEGIPLSELKEEVRTKERVLDWMRLNNISDYREVTRLINQYYKAPAEILKKIR